MTFSLSCLMVIPTVLQGQEVNLEPYQPKKRKDYQVIIHTEYGDMVVKLYDQTPLHKGNFLRLAEEGFFDQTSFHRVISGFMIQGGDPYSKPGGDASQVGQGGPSYTIPAEFVPELTHVKGALAAARQGDAVNPQKASSGSQFYLVQNPASCRHLNGQYTVFGQVTEGLEIIDQIAAQPKSPTTGEPIRMTMEVKKVKREKQSEE